MAKRRKEKASHGEVVEEEKGTNVFGRHKLYGLNSDFTWGSILLLAVVLTYQPIWYAGFVWDDASHLTANPCIVGPLGLKEIWTTSAALICSLVLTVFWLEHAVGGLAPLPYHLVNVLEHGLGAILLWRILRKLRVLGAWLGAALWALHPLQVESVAWVCEMKNTQSSLFYLLTVFFLRWFALRESNGQRKHWEYTFMLLFASLPLWPWPASSPQQCCRLCWCSVPAGWKADVIGASWSGWRRSSSWRSLPLRQLLSFPLRTTRRRRIRHGRERG
jgi:hypothetical protein